MAVVLLGTLDSSRAADVEPSGAAAWELRLLGVDDAAKLSEMRRWPKRSRVKLGVVGSGGVSEEQLGKLLRHGHTVTYHECADPKRNTHDTAMLRSILEKLTPLGVQVDLHLWQWKNEKADCAAKFRAAGEVCDVVCFYQSFWGRASPGIAKSIRESPDAIFVSPYVEHGDLPSGQSPQGQAHRPWAPEGIPHFVTVVPLARRAGQGRIVTPLDRGPEDCQPINFIAPSYHASGPGGTCFGGEVGTACAVYLCAAMPEKPEPAEVVEILRATSAVDRALLSSVDEFDEAAVDRLEKQVALLSRPPGGRQRKLDAPGVLNLYAAFQKAVARRPRSASGAPRARGAASN